MSARPVVSSVAFVFAFVGWLVRSWPTFTESFAGQAHVLISCAAIGGVGAWLAGLVVGVAESKVAAAKAVVDADRELTTIADVIGVMRPGAKP
jgi:hypothetical protein